MSKRGGVSRYLHPSFVNFIELFIARAANAPPRAAHKLQLLYSIAHAITYMTAAFLRSASFQLTPSSVKSLMPPPPLPCLCDGPRSFVFTTVPMIPSSAPPPPQTAVSVAALTSCSLRAHSLPLPKGLGGTLPLMQMRGNPFTALMHLL